MHSEFGRKSIGGSSDFINNPKLKGRGLINCRSCLGVRNSIRKEIQQVLMDRFGCNRGLDPEHPASHRDLIK
jgi:hypothetical protein